jgi:hypothetical protein
MSVSIDSESGPKSCQTWRDVTPAVPSGWYCQCLSPYCLEESVIGNSLYTLARYARWWRGGDVAQAELGTPARGHLADGRFVYYKYQLATQVDRGQVHPSRPDRPPQGKVWQKPIKLGFLAYYQPTGLDRKEVFTYLDGRGRTFHPWTVKNLCR